MTFVIVFTEVIVIFTYTNINLLDGVVQFSVSTLLIITKLYLNTHTHTLLQNFSTE